MQDSINNEKDVKSLIIRVKVKENCLEIYKEICEQTFMAIHSSLKSVIGITLSENIDIKCYIILLWRDICQTIILHDEVLCKLVLLQAQV